MMVPRAFATSPAEIGQSTKVDEKQLLRWKSAQYDKSANSRGPRQPQVAPRTLSEPPVPRQSRPVQIPSLRARRPEPGPVQKAPARSRVGTSIDVQIPERQGSVKELLSATAIPNRKRPKGRIVQRLPACDHVASFSQLLLEDVGSKHESPLSGSLGNPQFDGLFGNLDELVEGQMYVGSEGLDASVLSTRSVSSESMPSLVGPEDFSHSDPSSSPLLGKRSPSDRRLRRLATSEDCGKDHPLLHSLVDITPATSSSPVALNSAIIRPRSRPPLPKPNGSSFRSSLSASLKALKSAATTVSNIATSPTLQPDDFLTRSVFSIQPGLTDDKRPPPSDEPPSPALRRYLNPLPANLAPDSPAHLHFWHDDRPIASSAPKSKTKSKRKGKKGDISHSLPPVVPLQSCIPPAVRTAHASSPPIWLAPDGTPSNKTTAHANRPLLPPELGQPRQREPRENRDFLRVLVCEMNMRRSGKLEEKVEEGGVGGRAVLWLPPVNESEDARARRKVGIERWVSWAVDEL